MEKKYIQTDQLQKLINWDEILSLPRYAGGHDSQMTGLFHGAKVIAHWNEGDYQGMVATCVLLPDGRVAIYNDYYGSCSGCDSWEDATDEAVRRMCINLANSAYVFESLQDAMEYLKHMSDDEGSTGEWSSWNGAARSLLDSIHDSLSGRPSR